MATRTETRLIGVIRATCGVDVESPDVTLKSLNLDSMDMVELIMEVEDHFDILIPDEEADPFTWPEDGKAPTVADLAKLVDAKRAAPAED